MLIKSGLRSYGTENLFVFTRLVWILPHSPQPLKVAIRNTLRSFTKLRSTYACNIFRQ